MPPEPPVVPGYPGTNNPPTVPSTPDPALVSLVLTMLRYVVTAAIALGFVKGPYSDTILGTLAYTLVGVGMVAWALEEKVRLARHTHETAIINAERPMGSPPVQPV